MRFCSSAHMWNRINERTKVTKVGIPPGGKPWIRHFFTAAKQGDRGWVDNIRFSSVRERERVRGNAIKLHFQFKKIGRAAINHLGHSKAELVFCWTQKRRSSYLTVAQRAANGSGTIQSSHIHVYRNLTPSPVSYHRKRIKSSTNRD